VKFRYQAIAPGGEETSGVIDSGSREQATRQLQLQGLTPYDIAEATPRRSARSRRKPGKRDVLVTLHELTTLIESDVPIAEAVGSLANSARHPVIGEAFEQIATRLKRGERFADALAAARLDLPWYFGQLAASGEMTGELDTALRRGVEQMEYELEVASELRGALVYPSILIVTGVAAVLVVFMVVVPNFSGMVDLSDPSLPWLAWAVIATGSWFNAHSIAVVLGLSAAAAAIATVVTRPAIRQRALELLIRTPLVGTWLREAETGRWTAMLSTLLGSRVELVRALDMAENSVRIRSLRARLRQVTKATRAGTPLSEALRDNDAITATGCDLVAVGEKTGRMPEMLRSLARLYQNSGRERAKRALQLIEPVAILIIGGAIGVIITGVVLAITASQELGM
jgi:general secretion pathway protein F